MNTKYETHQMLVLSTEHLTDDNRRWLDKQANHNKNPCLVVYQKAEYGWFIPITENNYFVENRFPKNITNLLHATHVSGYTWLMIDRDADTIDELPVYRD